METLFLSALLPPSLTGKDSSNHGNILLKSVFCYDLITEKFDEVQ